MLLYKSLWAPLLLLKLCGIRDTVRPTPVDISRNAQKCTKIRDIAVAFSIIVICCLFYFIEILYSLSTDNTYILAFGAIARTTQILTYAFIFMRVIRGGREEAFIVKQMASIDRLLKIDGNSGFYNAWVGIKLAAIPFLAVFLDIITISYTLGNTHVLYKFPWLINGVATITEQILCGCFLAALSQRIDALVKAMEQSTDENVTDGLHRRTEELPLDCAQEVIERVFSVIHYIKIAFRKQIIMFTIYSFFVGLLLEEIIVSSFSVNTWVNYLRMVLMYIKTLAVLLLLCLTAESLNYGREKLCAALQRKVHVATIIQDRQKAKDLLRLVSSSQAEVLPLYGFISVRMQLIPTILGFFACYSVVMVQLGQGAFSSS